MKEPVGKRRRITVEEFLDEYASLEGRYELIDGAPVHLDDVYPNQSRVGGNVLAGLHDRLRRGPCRVFGPNVLLQISEYDMRLPVTAIDCDPADTAPENSAKRCLNHPRVAFEIISTARSETDWHYRLTQYLDLPGLDTFVEINVDRRRFTTYERAAGV
ncbi:MAG: Uma2 family endonuclease [Sphingomonas sp.]